MDLGERKIPSSASEPQSDARTPLADFFSILLGQEKMKRKDHQ
jgi:hypothetical protein